MSPKAEHANHFADVRRIEEWFVTTKPAHLAFTDGPERQVASHLEGLRDERDVAREQCQKHAERIENQRATIKLLVERERSAIEQVAVKEKLQREALDERDAAQAESAAMLKAHLNGKEVSIETACGDFNAERFDAACKECERVFGNPSEAAKKLLADLDAAQAECERLKKRLGELHADRDTARREELALMRELTESLPQKIQPESNAPSLRVFAHWLTNAAKRQAADLTRQNEAICNMGIQFDQQAQRNAATIAAMARRCEECDEAVALLRRWKFYADHAVTAFGHEFPLADDNDTFLVALDAEEKKLKEGIQ